MSKRTCAAAGCETVLSVYNGSTLCALHSRGTSPESVSPAPVPKPKRYPPVTLPTALDASAAHLNGRTTADEPVPLLSSEELSPPRGDAAFAAEFAARARVLSEREREAS